jgi:hypothetical protein
VVVPVSVRYEEASAVSTLLETNGSTSLAVAFQFVKNLLKLAWQTRFFRNSSGQARVNFNQPFSLKVRINKK